MTVPEVESSDAALLGNKIWEHPNPESTEMYRFKERVSKKYNVKADTYHDLWDWSIKNIAEFWGEVWDYTGVKASKPYKTVRPVPLDLMANLAD